MDASVLGKSLTPIPSQYITLFERTHYSPLSPAHPPASRRNSFLTSSIRNTPRLSFTRDKDVGTWYPEFSTPKAPVSRSNSGNSEKSLSDCHNTILSVDDKKSTAKSGRMPNAVNMRVKSSKISRNLPLIPLSSARSITPEIALSKPSTFMTCGPPEMTLSVDNKAKNNSRFKKDTLYSSGDMKKRRRKSAKRRKFAYSIKEDSKYQRNKQEQAKDCQSVLICKPTEICSRRKLLPPRTSSFILLQNMSKKPFDRTESALPSHVGPPVLSKHSNGSWIPDARETLGSNCDSSKSHKKKDKQLSMRIQLIHKYGSQDIIAKHLELKRKQELADKHRKKVIEVEAATKLKQTQRAKIYALNDLMTKLEKEQFEEYKRSVRV